MVVASGDLWNTSTVKLEVGMLQGFEVLRMEGVWKGLGVWNGIEGAALAGESDA